MHQAIRHLETALTRLLPAPRQLLAVAMASALVGLGTAVQAQTVYRCGPAGNQYSQQPCADGKAIDVSDPRSPAQAAEARAEVRQQQRLGAQMARERRTEERAHRPVAAGGMRHTAAIEAAQNTSSRLQLKKSAGPQRKGQARRAKAMPDESQGFVATVPGGGE